jgi:hypothetical protein
VVLAAPPGPLGGYPPQEMRPGAAVSAARSTGDVSVGAVGTVAYRDGDQVFAFGHPLDALGRRSLFLQDAYVFGVIGNPVGIPDLGAITYKLASSGGHPLGTVTNDLFPAIAGIVGQEPPSIPLRVAARERGGPGSVVLHSRLADERELGLGAGLSLVAPLAASTAIDRLLRSFEPATIVACTRFRVRELRRPIGYCNPYFDGFSMLGDVTDASILVDTFDLAPLHVTAAGVSIAASRGVIDEVIVGARARGTAQPGSRVPVRVELRRHGGGRRSLTVRVPVPRDLRPGLRTLVLEGNGFPDDEELFIEVIEEGLRRVARPGSSPALDRRRRARAAQAEPRTVRQLARAVARLRRPLGITARFRRREPRVVHASGRVRFDGRAKVRLRVRRAPR